MTKAPADPEVALRAGRWQQAAAGFAALDGPRAHEGLAQAAWWLDDADTCIEAREAAYRGFREVGDDRGAARAAGALGYDSILFGRGVAVGRGWLGVAGDLLAGRRDVAEAGWLEVRLAEVALNVDHDAAAALGSAAWAQEIGGRTGDGDLVLVGRALAGLALVRLGQVSEGMPLLDAASVAATAGDVEDLMWMGKICCWLIAACQEARDVPRAADWCARVEEICLRRDLTPLFAVCRTQYASVLLAQGECALAEATLTDVLARLDRSHRLSRLEAVAQLGELRRRQGRLDEAAELLHRASPSPHVLIGLAQIRLARGDPAHAWSTVTEVLRILPAEQLLERGDALAVAVVVALSAGHLERASGAATELRMIADRIRTPALLASAAAADARVCSPDAAVAHWQDAVRAFHAAGLVFDEAESRLDLAEILQSAGDPAGAREQAAAALHGMRSLEAGPAIARARALLDPGRSEVLTERQVDVLRLLARGLTNAEIAAALHLSEHTVHRHVANIYTALAVGSRAAAATYAAGRGLV